MLVAGNFEERICSSVLTLWFGYGEWFIKLRSAGVDMRLWLIFWLIGTLAVSVLLLRIFKFAPVVLLWFLWFYVVFV